VAIFLRLVFWVKRHVTLLPFMLPLHFYSIASPNLIIPQSSWKHKVRNQEQFSVFEVDRVRKCCEQGLGLSSMFVPFVST
jgi:hypothetical protein